MASTPGANEDGPVSFVHPTAEVAASAEVGRGTRIWHQAQLMEGVRVGESCVIGKGVFVGVGTTVGDRVKIGNHANLFGPSVEDEVQIGPLACIMEDPRPRATNPDGSLKQPGDFTRAPARVRHGASVGAGALVLPGVDIGRYAMVGAGAVVNRDVPDHAIVAGNPARLAGWACMCGERLDDDLRCGCGRAFDRVGDEVVAR